VELRRQVLTSSLLDPRNDFRLTRAEVEIRWDPLTGHGARLVNAGGRLLPASDFDCEAFARETATTCPFCEERIATATPQFPSEVIESGRLERGQAVLFPNLLAYAKHSAVSVYSPELHFLPLSRMTPELVADNLATQVQFGRAVMAHDPDAVWQSVNANHMLPSGSSLFHPHLQGGVDPVPTTLQRRMYEVAPERFEEYLALERSTGERYLGGERVEWVASFAPIVPYEFQAFIRGVSSPAELDDHTIGELGAEIAQVLNLYAELGFESFNMAMYGAPPGTAGYPLNLRIGCRSNLQPLYRSDAMYLERLHWEGAIEMTPEELAQAARGRLSR
jgi:galactose-1-phosphate uridylyltransferase